MVQRRHTSRMIQARWGCGRCSMGGTSNNAQALAAQHHDKRNHPTWVETTNRIEYGGQGAAAGQSPQRSML